MSLTLCQIKGATNTVIAELVVEPAHAIRRPLLGAIAPRPIPLLFAPRVPMLWVSEKGSSKNLPPGGALGGEGGTDEYLIFNRRNWSNSLASIIE